MVKEERTMLNKEFSRRDFLKGSTAVIGAVAGTAVLGSVDAQAAAAPCSCVAEARWADGANADPLQRELREIAVDFTNSPVNDMGFDRPERIWREPLFGVASGADPLWDFYKEYAVGEHHHTPREAFLLAHPRERAVRPEELSVFVWALPHTHATNNDNRNEDFLPSARWAISRWTGELNVNVEMRRVLVSALQDRGIQACAPYLLPEYSGAVMTERWANTSTFSERHAAYAAGLGTFSLSDGLITRAGKSVRFGSVVVRAWMKPTPRPYTDPYEYCLFFQDGSCAMCVNRCPVDSISILGRNKAPCNAHQVEKSIPHITEMLGFENRWGCGICQTLVPCEFRIP